MNKNNEVERLTIEERKIIHILLKHLMIQRNKNAYLKNKLALHSSENGLPEANVGTKNALDGIKKMEVGTPNVQDGIKEKEVGAKSVLGGIEEIQIDRNGGALLNSVFEKELIKALEDYIKNGGGRNTLYAFYTDFVDAVEERNSDAEKLKDAAANVRLEDTHELPANIPVDANSINKFGGKLRSSFPRKAEKRVNYTASQELLHLHNAGKATGEELRGFGGLSVAGFKKHLSNLKRFGLKEKLVPSNYLLTDKTKHILLELFGVEK